MRSLSSIFIGFAVSIAAPGHAEDAAKRLPPEVCEAKAKKASAELRVSSRLLASEVDYSGAHGNEMRPDVVQEFVDWNQKASAISGSDLPALSRTDLTLAETARRDAAVEQFQSERMRDLRAEAAAIIREADRGCPKLSTVDEK